MEDLLNLREIYEDSWSEEKNLNEEIIYAYANLNWFLEVLNLHLDLLNCSGEGQDYDDACWDFNNLHSSCLEFKDDYGLITDKINIIKKYLKENNMLKNERLLKDLIHYSGDFVENYKKLIIRLIKLQLTLTKEELENNKEFFQLEQDIYTYEYYANNFNIGGE